MASRSGINAQEIAVGNGIAYAISSTGGIYKWTGSTWTSVLSTPVPAGRLAVDPAGNPWCATTTEYIYEFYYYEWEKRAGTVGNLDLTVFQGTF